MSDVGTSSKIESAQSILADHAPGAGLHPPPARRQYKRGELKTDLAIQRHELMRENLALKNELAALRNGSALLQTELDSYARTILDLQAAARARCRWCPVRWGRAGK